MESLTISAQVVSQLENILSYEDLTLDDFEELGDAVAYVLNRHPHANTDES